MVANASIPLSPKSQKAFIAYYRNVQNLQNITRDEFRSRIEEIDRSYMREKDRTEENLRARQANRLGDVNRLQNITVPVVMPQVEAAVVHQTSVFLTGVPMFGVVADPNFIDEALQLETILDNNAIKGGWTRELMLFFRDCMKYNFGPVEVDWGEEVTYSVETNLDKNLKDGQPKEVIWSGNRLKRLDPYNTIVDTRVIPTEVYKKGEFGGYTEAMTRIELKAFISRLPDKIIANIVPAFESGRGAAANSTSSSSMGYYVPDINPLVAEDRRTRGDTNWMTWAELDVIKTGKIDYKDSYEVTTLYCKVLPSEFALKVSNSNTPQIYKLIVVNHEHIIYCELQTNAHNNLPILIGQPLEDGLGYQTKSLATNAKPFQEVTSGYMASIIASRRKAISDKTLYDPSRISKADIDSPNPSAKIPVRPAAYGKNIADSVFHFPYREDQAATSMQQIQTLLGMANSLNGQNQASQGQFVKGNKTLHEFESVMQNSNGRDQMASILLETQVFTPMKEIFKLNTLQFQAQATIYNRDKEKQIEIDPIKLRKAVLNFRISDGLTPKDKFINPETFSTALQIFGNSPQIAAQYNIGPLFSYFMKTQGSKIDSFEKSQEQIVYEQALDSWNNLAQIALEKGLEPKNVLPPMPLPEQFGYNPGNNIPKPEESDTLDSTPQVPSLTGIT